MSKVESQRLKQSFCQSRFYKSWNPDYIADYNRLLKKLSLKQTIFAIPHIFSLKDKHLKCYFKKNKTKKHLMVAKQITNDGRIVDEKDWRRNNIQIERKIKENEDEKKRYKQKEHENRSNRIEILRKIRKEEEDRRKVEDRRRIERGLKDAVPRFESGIEEVNIYLPEYAMFSEIKYSWKGRKRINVDHCMVLG